MVRPTRQKNLMTELRDVTFVLCTGSGRGAAKPSRRRSIGLYLDDGVRVTSILLAALVFLVLGTMKLSAGPADDFPNRPITLIVPSSAGGPADVAARLITDKMSQLLGQPIIIETMSGAGGTIGMARAARARPDGYTLLIHQTGHAIAPALYDHLAFDVAKDFVAVGMVNDGRNVLVGRQTLAANTFGKLVDWIRAPGTSVKIGHPGMGSMSHLSMMVLVRSLDVEVTMVPFRGVAPAVNDLLGGHIDLVEVAESVATPHIREGRLKPFATTSLNRNPNFPDVPTYGELGLQQMQNDRSGMHYSLRPRRRARSSTSLMLPCERRFLIRKSSRTIRR